MTVILMTEVKGYAKLAGWTGDDLDIATAIAAAESGLDPEIVSKPNADQWGSRDRGLFQINDHWHPEVMQDTNDTDPWKNTQLAYKIYQAAGNTFKPWATYNNGSYKQYLDKAKSIDSTAPGGDPTAQVQQNPPDLSSPFQAIANLGTTIMRSISSGLAIAIGGLLLVLGVVIILRQPIGKVTAKGVGIAAKAAL